MFKKFIAATVATLVIATASVSASTQAEAHGIGGLGIAASILGGVVIGTAIASQPHRDYVEEDVVVCKKVLYEDDYGNRYWKKICR